MTNFISTFVRRTAIAAAVATFCTLAPAQLRAQGEPHDMSELETMPKFSNASAAARTIANSYPSAMRSAGINGSVQLEFVVSDKGKVEPGSVQVVAASVPAFGEAAKRVAERIEFTPGMIKGAAVRARVLLPLVYKAN